MSFAFAVPHVTNSRGVQIEDTRICVVMVGLPARGKSLIAQKVVRYLRWLSIPAKTFNVGNYRRLDTPQPSASFFDTSNKQGEKMRHAAAEAAVNDMIKYFDSGEGIVAMFDATNSTRARREWVKKRCDENNIATLFVESKCDDEDLIMANIMEVKTTSPDYKGQDPEAAAKDFRNRIRNYEKVYQTIDKEQDEEDMTYVKIIDIGSRVIINNIKDYLQSRIVYYLMNLHIKPRSIWLSRHGESIYNLQGKIGGDASISHRGESYARALPALVARSVPPSAKLQIWTSTLKRTIQTARHLAASNPSYTKLEWKALDELDSGVCDGLTYAEIADKYPEDFAARDEDKYNYRYRGGESYRDVVIRLEPIIMELERSENVLVVTHQAVLRCIYAYYMNLPQEKSPWMEVPLHTLIKLTPRAYHTQEERFPANIPAVSTFREKGTEAKHQEGAEGKDAGVGAREQEDIERAAAEEREKGIGSGGEGDSTPADQTPVDGKVAMWREQESVRPQVNFSRLEGHMDGVFEREIVPETPTPTPTPTLMSPPIPTLREEAVSPLSK